MEKEKCIGCGACVSICPEVFEIANNGKVRVKENPTNAECVKEAATSCPSQAIEILEE